MTRSPLRGALIGCGFFAENHMHAWAGLADADIVALCDRDIARARAMAERFGIAETYADAAEMFAACPLDFADIATTVESHRPLVELAVRHVATVICQKPFAETLADGRAMVAAAEVAGAHLIVHENFRWQAPLVTLKAHVDAGRIGTPAWARVSFRHGYDNYVNQPYLKQIDRFAIMDVGLHLFDVARWLMGEVADVACTTQRRNESVHAEDTFTALLRHVGGGVAICDCTFDAKLDPEPFPGTAVTVEGDAGTVAVDAFGRLTLMSPGQHRVEETAPPMPPWGGAPWGMVQDSVVNFESHAIDVMRGRAAPQPSGADNLATLAVAFAAYDAADGRRVVRPEPTDAVR